MNTAEKPNFSQNVSSVDEVHNQRNLSELVEQRLKRPEIGAIWTRQAKSKHMEFLKIRLRLTRQQLQEILARTPDTSNIEELPVTEFVAFPNSFKDSNNKRPAYRIYEAKE